MHAWLKRLIKTLSLTGNSSFNTQVNTASRMESHGEPMKIHISEDSAHTLERFGEFIMEPRGQVDVKGKGPMNTYWLLGKHFDTASETYI